jgi:putative protein-disulfide isomerase
MAQASRPQLYYFYDALCGWCYGFSPVIQALYAQHHEQMDFQVISGGMIVEERIGPIGAVAPYIAKAYKQVENASGVRFGEAFLEGILAEGTAIFTSVPAAVALSVFKEQLPAQAVAFAAALQKAIYYDGVAPARYESFAPYAAAFALAEEAFLEKMYAPQALQAAYKDFALAAQFGIQGFPSLVIDIGAPQLYLLARGYDSQERINQRIEAIYQENKLS